MRWSPTSAEGQNHARGSASGRAAGPASERGEVPFLRSGADQRLGMSNQAHSGDSCLLPRTDCGCRNLCHQAVFMNHASGAVAALDPELIEVGDATGATPSPRPPSATCGPRPGPWPSLPPRSPRPWPVGPTTCATRRFPSGWRPVSPRPGWPSERGTASKCYSASTPSASRRPRAEPSRQRSASKPHDRNRPARYPADTCHRPSVDRLRHQAQASPTTTPAHPIPIVLDMEAIVGHQGETRDRRGGDPGRHADASRGPMRRPAWCS